MRHIKESIMSLIIIIALNNFKDEEIVIELLLLINLFFLSYYNFSDDILIEAIGRFQPFGGTYNINYTRLIISIIITLILFILRISLSLKIKSKKQKLYIYKKNNIMCYDLITMEKIVNNSYSIIIVCVP